MKQGRRLKNGECKKEKNAKLASYIHNYVWSRSKIMIDHKFFGLEDFEKETIPDHPPYPDMIIVSGDDKFKEETYKNSHVPARLANNLLSASFRLMELSKLYQGNYEKGCEIPDKCKACSTGAIVTACAAFEALLNELMIDTQVIKRGGKELAKCRLLEMSISLSPDKRFETMCAVFGKIIDWGSDPYQSLSMLLSVRKHLIH
jgi:hypothetical protein